MALGRGNIEIDIRGNVDTAGIARQVAAAEKQIRPLNVSLNEKGFRQPLGRISGDLAEFQKSLDASVARTLAFGAAVGVINSVSDAFKGLINSAVEVEKALTDVNVILNLSSQGLQKFSSDLFAVGRNTGQSFQAVSEAAVELSRQGLGAEETLKRINDAMILTRLSGMDAAKSVETLTAAVNSFGSTALTTTDLVNKLATVDAAFAVSTEDLANALARAGSTAQAAKVDLNELLAAVTSVQQTTARGGSVIGNAFKSIFTRIQRSGVREALEEIGVATTDAEGNIRGALDILSDYAQVYKTLSDGQKAYTDELIAGVFQINNLRALVKDLGSGFSIYQRALDKSNNASDEAVRRNEQLQKTLSSLINEASLSAKELAATLGELVATPAVENLLKIFNSIAGALKSALDPEEGSKLIQGVFKTIGSFISGPGLILIAAGFIKLFKFITSQSVKAVGEIFKIGSAKDKIADAEAKIGFLLKNNRALYEAISNEALTHEQREDLVLRTIKEQNQAYQQQQALINRIARSGPIQRGLAPSRATGYIPNFANGVTGAIKAEEAAVSSGVGGASKAAKPKVLKNFPMGGGKRETVVANTDEVIVPKFGGGTGSAIFNQDMIDKFGMPDGAIPVSRGYVPSFAKSKLNLDKNFQSVLADFKGVNIDVQRDMTGFGLLSAKGRRGNLEVSRQPGFSRQDKLSIIDSIGGSKLNKEDKDFLLTTIGGKKRTRFSNIPAQTIESASPEEVSKKVGALNNLINPYIADAVASVATNIYTRVLGDEVSAQNLVKNVRASANADQGIISKGAQGDIFESAVRLGSKESAKNLAKDDRSAIWDFEESGPMSADLKGLFFPTSNIYKADAKRTGDQDNLREVVDKAYKADFTDELRQIYGRNWAPIVSAAAKVAPSKQKTERKRFGKNLAGGYIPNFAGRKPKLSKEQLEKVATRAKIENQQKKEYATGEKFTDSYNIPSSFATHLLSPKRAAPGYAVDHIGRSGVNQLRKDYLGLTQYNKYHNAAKIAKKLTTQNKVFDSYGKLSKYLKKKTTIGNVQFVAQLLSETRTKQKALEALGATKLNSFIEDINKLSPQEEEKKKKQKLHFQAGNKFEQALSILGGVKYEVSPDALDFSRKRGRKLSFDQDVAKMMSLDNYKGYGDAHKGSGHGLKHMQQKIISELDQAGTLYRILGFGGEGDMSLYSKANLRSHPFPDIVAQGKDGIQTSTITFKSLYPKNKKAFDKLIQKKYKKSYSQLDKKTKSLLDKRKITFAYATDDVNLEKINLHGNKKGMKELRQFLNLEKQIAKADGFIPNFFGQAINWNKNKSTNQWGLSGKADDLKYFGEYLEEVSKKHPDIVSPKAANKFLTRARSAGTAMQKERDEAKANNPIGFGRQGAKYYSGIRNASNRSRDVSIDGIFIKNLKDHVKHFNRRGSFAANYISENGNFMADGYVPNFALSQSMIEGLRAKLRPGSGATDAEKRSARRALDKEERSNVGNINTAIIDSLKFSKKQVQGAIGDVVEQRNSLDLDPQPIVIDQRDAVKFAEEYIKKVNKAKRAFTNEKIFGTPLSTNEISLALKGQGGYRRGKYIPQRMADGFIPNFANALQEAVTREEQALKSQGSSAKVYVDQDKRLKSSQNPMGLLVANKRDEPSGGFQGVNRAMSMGMDPKTHGMASGRIPNFADIPLMNPAQLEAYKAQIKANKEVGKTSKVAAKDIAAQTDANEKVGKTSEASMGKLLAFQIGLSTIETSINMLVPGMESFSLKATQAGFAIGELSAQLGTGLSKSLGSIGQFASKKGLGKVGQTFGKLSGAVGKLVPGIGLLTAGAGLLYDAYENGAFKTFGLYDKQKELIKSTERYTKVLEKNRQEQAQNIERIDQFSSTLAKLHKASEEENIKTYTKYLKDINAQIGGLKNIDPSKLKELIEAAGDAEKLAELTQELKDSSKGLGNFSEDFNKLTKEVAEAGGNLNKVDGIGGKIEKLGETFLNSLSPEQISELNKELQNFNVNSEKSSDKFLSLQGIFGELDDELVNIIKGNESLTKRFLISAKSQADYRVEVENLTQASLSARQPVKNLSSEISKLSNAIESSIANLQDSFKTLSEIGKIEAESRTKQLQATSVITPEAMARGTALADLARAQQEAAREIKNSLKTFVGDIVKNTEGNQLTPLTKDLIESVRSGDINVQSALEGLQDIQKSGSKEQVEAATQALKEIQDTNRNFQSSQLKIDATLKAQLREAAIQSAIFRRDNQLSEAQLKSLTAFRNFGADNLKALSALKESFELVESLGGDQDILAELKAGNRKRSELENLEAAFSQLGRQTFDALNLRDLQNQVDSFTRSDSFSQLDLQSKKLITALASTFDDINKFELEDKGVGTAREVAKAKEIKTPEEAISSLAKNFEKFSSTLADGLSLDGETIAALSPENTLEGLASSITRTSEENAKAIAANTELQKKQVNALVNAASSLNKTSGNLEEVTRAINEAATAIRSSNPGSASGFVPSFSANSQAVARAVTTERNLGGKPVVDYNSTVGTYVRDGNTQPNFAAVKRDHPEGIRKASQNSKVLQGMAASRGFVPNFFYMPEDIDDETASIMANPERTSKYKLKEWGFYNAIGLALGYNSFTDTSESEFPARPLSLKNQEKWKNSLWASEAAWSFFKNGSYPGNDFIKYNLSKWNPDAPNLNGFSDGHYMKWLNVVREAISRDFIKQVEGHAENGNFWQAFTESYTPQKFYDYMYENATDHFNTKNWSKKKYKLYPEMKFSEMKHRRAKQFEDAMTAGKMGGWFQYMAGAESSKAYFPNARKGLTSHDWYTFSKPVSKDKIQGIEAIKLALFQGGIATGIRRSDIDTKYLGQNKDYARYLILNETSSRIEELWRNQAENKANMNVPNTIKISPDKDSGMANISYSKGGVMGIKRKEISATLPQFDKYQKALQNRILSNKTHIANKRLRLEELTQSQVPNPETGELPSLKEIKSLQNNIKDVEDQNSIYENEISKIKEAKLLMQENEMFAEKYFRDEYSDIGRNPLYLNSSAKATQLTSMSKSDIDSQLQDLLGYHQGDITYPSETAEDRVGNLEKHVFGGDFNKNTKTSKTLNDRIYNSALPNAYARMIPISGQYDLTRALEGLLRESSRQLLDRQSIDAISSVQQTMTPKEAKDIITKEAGTMISEGPKGLESIEEIKNFKPPFDEPIDKSPESDWKVLDMFHNALLGRSIEQKYEDANSNFGEVIKKFRERYLDSENAVTNKKKFLDQQISARTAAAERHERDAGDLRTPQQRVYAKRAEQFRSDIQKIEELRGLYDRDDANRRIIFDSFSNPLKRDDGKPIYPLIPTSLPDFADRYARYSAMQEQYNTYKNSGNFLKLNPNNQYAQKPYALDYARLFTGTFFDNWKDLSDQDKKLTFKRLGWDFESQKEMAEKNPKEHVPLNVLFRSIKENASNNEEAYLADRMLSPQFSNRKKLITDQRFAKIFERINQIGLPLIPGGFVGAEGMTNLPQIKLVSKEKDESGMFQEYNGGILPERDWGPTIRDINKLIPFEIKNFQEKNKEFFEKVGAKTLPEMLAKKKINFMEYPQYLEWLRKNSPKFNIDNFVNDMLNNTKSVENFEQFRNKYKSSGFTGDKETAKILDLRREYGNTESTNNVLSQDKPVEILKNNKMVNPFQEFGATPFQALQKVIGEKLEQGKNADFEKILNNKEDPLKDFELKKIGNANTFIKLAQEKAESFPSFYSPFGYFRTQNVNPPTGLAAQNPESVKKLINMLYEYEPKEEGKARGFIPNFSAVAGEIMASKAAGYKTPVTPSQVKTINIPGAGKTSYNTQESVFKMPGVTQPFIAPPSNSKAAKSYASKVQSKFNFNPYKKAAEGFVPNFAPNQDRFDSAAMDDLIKSFSSIADSFSSSTASFSEAVSNLNFQVFADAAEKILQSSQASETQSNALKEAAGLIQQGASALAQGQGSDTDFSALTSAASTIQDSLASLSNQLGTKIEINDTNIITSMNTLTAALKTVSGKIDVKVSDVKVDVSGNVSSAVRSAIQSEIPPMITDAIVSIDISAIAMRAVRDFMGV